MEFLHFVIVCCGPGANFQPATVNRVAESYTEVTKCLHGDDVLIEMVHMFQTSIPLQLLATDALSAAMGRRTQIISSKRNWSSREAHECHFLILTAFCF